MKSLAMLAILAAHLALLQVTITPGAPGGTINSTTNVTNTNVTNQNTTQNVTNQNQSVIVYQTVTSANSTSLLANNQLIVKSNTTAAILAQGTAAPNSLLLQCNALRRTNCR